MFGRSRRYVPHDDVQTTRYAMDAADRLADVPSDVARAAARATRELVRAEALHPLIGMMSAADSASLPAEVIEDWIQTMREATRESLESPDDVEAQSYVQSTRLLAVDGLTELADYLRATQRQVRRGDARRAFALRLNRYLAPTIRRSDRPRVAARRRRSHRSSLRARSPGRKDPAEPPPPKAAPGLAPGGRPE